MVVILEMDTGTSYLLDRSLSTEQVSAKINLSRASGELIPFANNETPSRQIWIDPAHVVAVKNDGHTY